MLVKSSRIYLVQNHRPQRNLPYPQDIHPLDRPLHLKVRFNPSPWSIPSPDKQGIIRTVLNDAVAPLISFAQGSH